MITKKINNKDIEKLCESLELLDAIHKIEHHNKNWLPAFAINNPKALSEEKMNLIENCLEILGTTAGQPHT